MHRPKKIFYQKNAPKSKKNCTSFHNEMQSNSNKGCKTIYLKQKTMKLAL